MTLPTADLQVRVSIDASKLNRETKKNMKLINDAFGKAFSTSRGRKSLRVVRNNAKSQLKVVEKKIDKELSLLGDGTKTALLKILNRMKRESVAITPRDTGKLRRTAFVFVERLKTKIVGKFGFNITSGSVPTGVEVGAEYTVHVHENRNVWHNPPTRAGFFLEVVQNHQSTILTEMAAELRKRRK